MTANNQATSVATIDALGKSQAILEDYYFASLPPLDIDSTMWTPGNACFDIEPNAVFEFYLSAVTMNNVLTPGNEVIKVSLIMDIGVEVATATYTVG